MSADIEHDPIQHRTDKSLDEPPNRILGAGALLLLTPVAWFVAFAIADGLSQDGSRSAGQPWDAILSVLLVTFAASLPVALVGLSVGTLASAWRRPVEWLWLLPAATGGWLLWFLALLGEDEPTRHTWWEFAAMLVAAALVAVVVMRWPHGAWRWLLLTIGVLAVLCILLAVVMAPMMA
jgi:hypothetical protein